MERAEGDHVAFLTQDAVPADGAWLERLLAGFELAGDVALVFGPYLPRPDASAMVARELLDWFGRLAPDGAGRVDRLADAERGADPRTLYGQRSYFTDANGCVARAAWEEVPFRPVPYAEDHALALDMLRAGYAKAFVPAAAVIHSHEYSAGGWLRRAFDEARAIHDVYGFATPADPRVTALGLWGRVSGDWRWAAEQGRPRSPGLAWRSLVHHAARAAGSILGGRAQRLPPGLARRLSLERR